MEQEIELKLLVTGDVRQMLFDKVFPELDCQIKQERLSLVNGYFDTPELAFRHHDIGFRVRSTNGVYEQTVKLKGQSIGGLHSRPEFNVPLTSLKPDLSLFAADIWPKAFDVADTQIHLTELFTTNFTRHVFTLELEKGCIELVWDQGEVSRQSTSVPINELELELKSGDANVIFDIARVIAKYIPASLGHLSKAARGYMLVNGRDLSPQPLPELDAIIADNAHIHQTVHALLNYWQHHQSLLVGQYADKARVAIQHSAEKLLGIIDIALSLQPNNLLEIAKHEINATQSFEYSQHQSLLIHLALTQCLFNGLY